MTALPAVAIAGVPVRACDRTAAATAILDAARAQTPLTVHLCNAYVLALASKDRSYGALLARGDLNLADGAPVAWFASRAGLNARARPSGVELFEEVTRSGVPYGVRHYLYGSSPKVVQALADRLRSCHPGLEIVGIHAPPYGPVTSEQVEELVASLSSSQAQVLWIGLGTPKQDLLVDRLSDHFNGACVPVGAAFDFIAGSVPRAPAWMRRTGLEWVHRLCTEPRRLWRRYLWGNARFLWALVTSGRVLRRPDGEPT